MSMGRREELVQEVSIHQMARRTVLVVEDSEVIRRVIQVILEGEGYEVVCAESGVRALALARQHHPNAVTLDLSLPDLDGLEVLRRLKANAHTRHIPVIVLSAFADVLAASERSQATRVMTKPFDVDELLACVDDLTTANGRRAQPGA